MRIALVGAPRVTIVDPVFFVAVHVEAPDPANEVRAVPTMVIVPPAAIPLVEVNLIVVLAGVPTIVYVDTAVTAVAATILVFESPLATAIESPDVATLIVASLTPDDTAVTAVAAATIFLFESPVATAIESPDVATLNVAFLTADDTAAVTTR